MFSRDKNKLFFFVVGAALYVSPLRAEEAQIAPVNIADLPINVAEQNRGDTVLDENKTETGLVSPSKAKSVDISADTNEAKALTEEKHPEDQPAPAVKEDSTDSSDKSDQIEKSDEKSQVAEKEPDINDFDFDLKMKSLQPVKEAEKPAENSEENIVGEQGKIAEEDLPQDIQYKTDPIENLGNSILSQLDNDLFKQMSDIEKSTTLLTLELRREKLRNEIEAQKAIRQKAADDIEKQKAEEKLKEFERKKQIEANVFKEKQALLSQEKIFEVLKQRKLLNAYMNQMLLEKQSWLKEKEVLYGQLEEKEKEKQELIRVFKEKVDSLLEVSAKNMQLAEAAKKNFERIIKGLKARNEQLKKRIEADAKIIKSAQASLYLKSQAVEELKNKAQTIKQSGENIQNNQTTQSVTQKGSAPSEEVEEQVKLNNQYAILGIIGRGDNMSVEVIDIKGQPISLKVGSSLPTGHVVSEIGSDYAKFSRDGEEEYLYIGRSIEGITPSIEEPQVKN
jgi:hypothetical protein